VRASTPEDFINTKSGPIHLFSFEQQIKFGALALRQIYAKAKRSGRRLRDDSAYSLAKLADGAHYTALD